MDSVNYNNRDRLIQLGIAISTCAEFVVCHRKSLPRRRVSVVLCSAI